MGKIVKQGDDQLETQTMVLSWWMGYTRTEVHGVRCGKGSEVLTVCFCPTGGGNMGILLF